MVSSQNVKVCQKRCLGTFIESFMQVSISSITIPPHTPEICTKNLLIDFEKAFDTVEWSFIDKCLKYFNFGASLRSWIKTFYSSISSSVCSNGHIPEFFKISRGVRQSDPLSPYLFLIDEEVLYRAANRNKKIIGVSIDSYTFLMNQLADDTCMFSMVQKNP